VQDLHQNGRHSHLQVIENDSYWRGATDKWITTTNTTSYKNPSQFSKITLKRKKEKLKHKTNTILLYQLFFGILFSHSIIINFVLNFLPGYIIHHFSFE
jgi:hypothetical protein